MSLGRDIQGASVLLVMFYYLSGMVSVCLFISLCPVFGCLKCSLIDVYIEGKVSTGKKKNVKGMRKMEGMLEKQSKGEGRRSYRARMSTNFTFLHTFWCQ